MPIGCDIELSKLLFKKKILCMFPMHDKEQAKQLLAKCWQWSTMPWDIPTHDLKEYFGEKIALYNVFIAHYSYWFGFVLYLVSLDSLSLRGVACL